MSFFDIDTKQIGWAESACDYTATVQQLGYSFDITGELKAVEEAGGGGGGDADGANNENNAAAADAAAAPNVCEAITSGNKCGKNEDCSWGWGKCTQKAGALATVSPTVMTEEISTPPPKAAHVVITDSVDDNGSDEDNDNDNNNDTAIIQIDTNALMETAKKNGPEIIIVSVILSIILCSCYCLWCRKDNSTFRGGRKSKYTRSPNTEVEMTFQDEPSEDNSNNNNKFVDDNSSHLSVLSDSKSNGSKTSSQFRDEPEFDGDFA